MPDEAIQIDEINNALQMINVMHRNLTNKIALSTLDLVSSQLRDRRSILLNTLNAKQEKRMQSEVSL